MPQVFISYSRKDLSFVKQLAADLKNVGLDVWYDVSGISGGSRWRTEIENAIRNSQYVLVVLSPDSIASEWVEREFLFSSNLKRKIIPLMYRPCELPLNYVDLNYIDVQGENYQRAFPDLLRALNLDPKTAPLPPTRKPSFPVKSKYFVSTIVVIVLLFGGLFISQLNRNGLSAATMPALPTSTSRIVSTDTAVSTLIAEPSSTQFIPTITPLPAEMTDAKGVQMMLVPAGEFMMGSENEDDERPVHTVYLDDFYVDTFEVTNILYKACVAVSACDKPRDTSRYNNSEYANHPVVYVDWDMAQAYCEWRNAKLPTESQWEKVARGTDARIYPWGNSIDTTFANYLNIIKDTSEVGSYANGRSVYGVYDLAGNVWEWVADHYGEDYYFTLPPTANNPAGPASGKKRVIRGGSWNDSADVVRSSNRAALDPTAFGTDLGFRCAKDVTP